MAGTPRAPLSTRGFYGQYSRRGRAELKFVDTTATNVAVTTSWQLVLLNGVTQGTDYNSRIGRQMMNKSIIFNGNIFPVITPSTSATQGLMFRTVIIYDTQPNSGSLPAGTDIFVANDPHSPMNLNNRDRFKVLMDKKGQLGSYLTSAGGTIISGAPQNLWWAKYKKCFLETVFSGTTNAIGSIATGAIYLCFIGDFASISLIDYYTRVRFTDQ